MTIQMTTDHTTQGGSAGVLAQVRTVFNAGRTRSVAWREEQLRAIERMCEEREAEISEALIRDLGRSAFEAWLGDIASTKAEAVFARKHFRKWMKPQRQSLPLAQMPGRAWVQYDPIGVVLVIGPWNYPFFLCMSPVVAAVAAGNGAVIKPSELAPATSELIARLVPQYLDPEAIRVVEGAADVTQDLLSQGFDHALFTGGTEIGRKIMAAAAPTLNPVTLELGGKSPVLVLPDADLDVTARRIAWTKLLNSGQTCIAPDYVLADRAIARELTEKIVATIAKFRADQTNDSLRIVNERQFDRLVSLLATTTGTVVTGGGSDRSTLSIDATVIVDPAPDDPVMADEIFGPILPIITVGSTEEAVAFVNSRPKPLALYVFTASQDVGRDLVDRMPSGGAVINHIAMHCLVPQLPFGGIGASGMGAYHGQWGFEALSHRRAVLSKPAKPDPSLLYPPYTDRAMKILRRLL